MKVLTSKLNLLFEPIARLNSITGDDKNKQGSIAAALSDLVGPAGQMSNLLIWDLKALGEFINHNEGLIRIGTAD
jgi:hypothetical protein